MKKRMLVLLLALVMTLSLLPFSASAAEIVQSGSCGENLTWVLTDDGVMTISGTGAMDTDGCPWKKLRTSITKVVVKSGVTSIEGNAFFDCSSLTSVTIPDSVTKIEYSAFSGCSSLTSIAIPNSVTEIGGAAFSGCSSLTSVTIPNGVKKIEADTFSHCSSLANVTIPDSVNEIGISAFEFCSSLTSVTIPNGVPTIDDFTFFGCRSLTSVTIPASVTAILQAAFQGTGLKDVYYGGTQAQWDNINRFDGNSELTRATLHLADDGTDPTDPIDLTDPTDPTDPTNPVDPTDPTKPDDQSGTEPTDDQDSKPADEQDTKPTDKDDTKPADQGDSKDTDKPEVNNPFVDVEKEEYYFEPVLWAVSHDPQITNGMDETHFEPNTICNRAQVVTFLWRAKGEPTPKTQANPYKDVSKTDYFYDAVLWAMENGITVGTSDDTFSPKDPCTRAHVVTFLWRAEGKPEATGKIPFEDIPAEEYFTDAVSWAVNHNPQITNGMDETHFEPNTACTRGQVVTFLHRDMSK